MAVLKYSHSTNRFGLFGEGNTPFAVCASPYAAVSHATIATEDAQRALAPFLRAIEESLATDSILKIPKPEGLEYLPFQKAGIAYASRRMHCLIGDEMGLGKTIQAIGLANYLGLERILVVCPAGLRLNWVREIDTWHMWGIGAQAILNGKERIEPCSTVISYDLAVSRASDIMKNSYDLIVVDECHYVKNMKAARTKAVLGSKTKEGLLSCASRRLVLTGTPIPNRVNEIYPILRTLAPHIIDNMSYSAFLGYYAVTVFSQYGDRVVGIKHEDELYARMRAGFMVRRLKADVLKDLPPKRYSMIVFPADGGMRKVLKREEQFSAREIIKHGTPVGSALPEIRREMGIAKAPTASRYIADLLEGGLPKVVVFCHHKDVVSILEKALADYGAVTVTGQTQQSQRQERVDRFQTDPAIRVFIGNIVAAGVGITLTAAQDVVFAECSWVPGENDQAADRVHRVGQHGSVQIHYLVVEGSLDAVILSAAAGKRTDISKVLDGAL